MPDMRPAAVIPAAMPPPRLPPLPRPLRLAPPSGGDQFAELSDDDGELPF